MKAKPLPDQSLLCICLSYDPLTGELVWKHRPDWTFKTNGTKTLSHIAKVWNSTWAGKPAFTAVAKNRYLKGAFRGDTYYAHRIIYKMVTGTDPDDVDHDNGVRGDNRWENLLSKSRGDNLKNRCLSSNNTSGYHGVSYSNRHKLWNTTIYDKGISIHLGWFKDFDLAVAARKDAEVLYGYHSNHGRSA